MSNLPPFRSRLLGDLHSPSPPKRNNDSRAGLNLDFAVVLLLALLCAEICVLGLTVMAHWAWSRWIIVDRSPSSSSSSANKGNGGTLKKKVLNELPKRNCTPDDARKFSECAICLSEFAAGDEIRVLPGCGHGYHVLCIDTWLGNHSSCPSCRRILVVGAGSHACSQLPTVQTDDTL